MQPSGILIHYAELGTKGANRRRFIDQLLTHIRKALAGLPRHTLQSDSGRILVFPKDDDVSFDAYLERLRYVPGIAWYAPVHRCALDMEAMQRTALAAVSELSYATFRVRSRRVFKELPYSSQQTDREVGAYLAAQRPAKVQLKGADLEVGIEMMPRGALVFTRRLAGVGGLPVGASGRVLCLLSGGIDSPVAAYRMLRRGCKVDFVHFHSAPLQSRASQEKAEELVEQLVRYQYDANLFLVPFAELQREIVTTVAQRYRVILYRRFMVRIAAQLAAQQRAKALVSGESVGQVASQTLENLAVIDAAAPMLVLRPLLGYDKDEIIEMAQRIDTYTISTQPDQDCCQLFMPKRPELTARRHSVERAEAALDVESWIDDAVQRTERKMVGAPWWQPENERQAELRRPKRRHAKADDANQDPESPPA